MKESVRTSKHPWIVGIIMGAIAVTYFMLLGESGFQEPAPAFQYQIASYRDVDNVETAYDETGFLDPKLDSPQAMSIGADGRIYIAGANEIVVFGKGDREVNRIAVDGKPKCMTVTPDGTIFVGYSDHVEVMNAEGTVEAVWEPRGSHPFITSIAVLEDDVFLGDAGHKVVLRYDREGNFIGEIGKKNEDEDIPGIQVPSPHLDLAINDEGDLWVVNPGLLGMERYRTDGSIVTSWYKPTLKLEGFSGCCNPTHVAFTGDGKLITAEKGLVRVKVYDVTNGEYKELVAGSKLFPREQSLKDIVVDQDNRILVLDPRNNMVRIFEEKETRDEKRT